MNNASVPPTSGRPISVQTIGSEGYVWNAEDAYSLRAKHGITGTAIGGVPYLKQQNNVSTLPIQLNRYELQLLCDCQAVEPQPPLGVQAALTAAARAARKRRLPAWEEEEAAEGGGGRGAGNNAKASVGGGGGGFPGLDGGSDGMRDGGMGGDDTDGDEDESRWPAWKVALADERLFEIPHCLPAAAATVICDGKEGTNGEEGGDGEEQEEEEGADAVGAAAEGRWRQLLARHSGQSPASVGPWRPLASAEEVQRVAVVWDLRDRGYCLTGGIKFGGELLAYPGDPTMFHAQFVVRVLPHRAPLLPVLLAGATRGAHTARKHLLLACVLGEEEEGMGERVVTARGDVVRIRYLTVAPEAGFAAPKTTTRLNKSGPGGMGGISSGSGGGGGMQQDGDHRRVVVKVQDQDLEL